MGRSTTAARSTGRLDRSQRLAALLALIVLVSAGSMVVARAGHEPTGVGQYTGCLATSGAQAGKLVQVKAGAEPRSACSATQQLIHLSGGDITGISTAADSGLQGGVNNGRANLAISTPYKLPQGCTDTAVVPKWNGSAWACAPDRDTDTDTTYTAGTGLGLSGTQFTLAAGYALPQGCTSPNVVPKWNGSAWACAPDTDTDTNTTYTAGTGLELSKGEFTLAPGFALPQECAEREYVPKWDGESWVCAPDADTDTDTNTTYTAGDFLDLTGTDFDVTGAPWAGLTGVPSGFADGNDADSGATRPTFAITSTPDAASAGSQSSIAIGADGLPLIAYREENNNSIKVMHCSNIACTAASALTPVGAGGEHPSLAIGRDGFGLISYWDGRGLLVVHCTNAACSTRGSPRLIDSAAGAHSAITIGADGFGLISYYDEVNRALKVAHCTDIACSEAIDITTVDAIVGGDVGRYSSIVTGADGFGLISYRSASTTKTNGGGVRIVHCTNAACSTSDPPTPIYPETPAGEGTSIALGADGLGLVAFYEPQVSAVVVVHCMSVRCHDEDGPTVVDGDGWVGNPPADVDVGKFPSVAIGTDGLAAISYWDATNTALKVARCANVTCTAIGPAVTVDDDAAVGEASSIAIGADGFPIISYYDASNTNLKVVHCSNPSCVPYARPS